MTVEPRDKALFASAAAILRDNDRGAYTVPTKGLYPFQWNWDSCLTALGQRHFDEARAWTEIETLLANQWPDGMVPHIVFHETDDGYFPGPGRVGRPTGRRRPPASPSRRCSASCSSASTARSARQGARPRAGRWNWCPRPMPGTAGSTPTAIPAAPASSPSSTRGNPAATIRSTGTRRWRACRPMVVQPYRRRDTQHVNAAERPTQAEYDRYMWLVQHFRDLGWDNSRLHDASPFQVVDPGFNAILVRSDEALASLADATRPRRRSPAAARARSTRRARRSMRCGATAAGQFLCFDRVAGKLVDSRSVGGLLPAFAGLGDTDQLIATIRRWRASMAIRRRLARSRRPALRTEALLARALLADRQLHAGRRAAPQRPRRTRRRRSPPTASP